MEEFCTYSLNSGQRHGTVMLEEDMNKEKFNEKPLEIDEACYSLEEPEHDETKALTTYNSLLLVNQSVKMSLHKFQGSETSGNVMIYSRNNAGAEPFTSQGVLEAMRLDEPHNIQCSQSEANVQRSGSHVSSVNPDFDHLLLSNCGPESTGALQMRCQELILAGHKLDKIFSELRAYLGYSSDGNEDASMDVTFDGIDEDASWTEAECLEIVEMMRIGLQCNDPSCHSAKCQLGQRFTVDIEADLENFDVLLPLVTRRLLDSVIVHSSLCDDSLCSVPWCLFFTQYCDLPLEEQRAALQSRYRKRQFAEDFEEINIDISASSEFILLEDDIMWPCVEHVKLQREVASETGTSSIPRNGIDFLVNGHFGKYGQLGLTAISTTIPPVQLNVIQFVSWENCIVLWKRLKGLRHENIVRHLWSCVDSSNVTVCRDHFCTDTESLECLVNKVKPRKIDTNVGLSYVAGLVSAVRYLNDHGIYYLNWTASGIQMNYNYTLVQLSDFSLAVTASMLEKDKEMIDIIANSLPPFLLPPEMFSSGESESSLGSFTEVWGIGCIMYHLSCGHPVHHNIRHEPLESVREKVESFGPNSHLKLVQPESMKKILADIFTVEESRIDLHQLALLLQTTLSKANV